ncbi:hypothetical protein [Xanthomonas phage BUDD]|nr:hypothetical protein [Xanthomonas phage BUDD]
MLFGIEIGDGGEFSIAGALTGQFLQASWGGKPAYVHPAHVVETTWGNGTYVGAGIARRSHVSIPTIVQQQFIKPAGFDQSDFGVVQTSPNSKYIHATGGKLDSNWFGARGYSAPVNAVGASWSDQIVISPLAIESTLTFGAATIIPEQNIEPSGWVSTQFGNNYVLHWYEYAPPMWTLDGSWAGKDEYFDAKDGVIHALWRPPADSQTIAPIAFVDSAMGSPRVRRAVKPEGIASTANFGIAQLFPSICSNWTYRGATNRIPITFDSIAESYPSNRIPIQFRCGSSGIRYSDFEGFIEAREGGELQVKMYDGYLPLNFFDGAAVAPIELTTRVGIPLNFYDGASWIGGRGCVDVSGLVNIGSSGNATPNPALNSVRLQNSGDPTVGSVVGTPLLDTSGQDSFEYSWTQTLNGPWYDNDFTDAWLEFGVFFNRPHSTITTAPGYWEYATPFNNNNSPWLSFRIPRDSESKTVPVYARVGNETITLQPFEKPAGLDFFAGGNRLRVRFLRNGLTLTLEIYYGDTLLSRQNVPVSWPTSVAPVWYYRNYNNPSSYIDLANMLGCTDGLLTTYPATNFNFGASFYDGASASLDLSTSTILPINEFAEGANLSTVLDTRPVVTLPINIYDGAAIDLSLNTTSTLQPVAYDGGVFGFDISINPSADLLFAMADGASASIGLSTALQIGTVGLFEGASVSASLDTLENYYIYDGAFVEVGFSTETTLPMDGYAGESVSVVLDARPSQGIGTLNLFEGSNVVTSFTTLPQVLLYPNEIKDGHSFNYDILGFMGIDLLNTACCPIKENPARIELSAGPAPDERYDGDKTVFTAELSTLPRFQLSVYSGERFDTVDPEYLTFNFYEGSNAIVDRVEYSRYNFALCEGNFLPDGDHVNVELVATDSLCNDSTLIFDGGFVDLDLQNNVQFQVPLPTGENLDAVVTIDNAWILNIYEGPYVRVSNPEFVLEFRGGEMSSVKFEEEDIYGFSGEFVSAVLSTDYDVEFLEVGCLDNEFVPANENGDPDWDKFNPVPVELDFFSHSIKARCF